MSVYTLPPIDTATSEDSFPRGNSSFKCKLAAQDRTIGRRGEGQSLDCISLIFQFPIYLVTSIYWQLGAWFWFQIYRELEDQGISKIVFHLHCVMYLLRLTGCAYVPCHFSKFQQQQQTHCPRLVTFLRKPTIREYSFSGPDCRWTIRKIE